MNRFVYRIKCISPLLTIFTLNNNVLAQDQFEFRIPPSQTVPEFVTFIDGSKNPELINDNTIFGAFVSFLVETSPANCDSRKENPVNPGFSNTAPCIESLAGIDMEKAVQLANEYKLRQRINSELPMGDFCGARAEEMSRMSIAEFSAYMDESQKYSDDDEAAFFVKRAQELFDAEGFENLMKYAERYRTQTVKTVIDQNLLMTLTKLTPAVMVQRWCAQFAQP